jgi:hypothetical protein
MEYIIYSFLAAFTVSLHLFSIKLLSSYTSHFYTILIFTTITLLLSRYFIYMGMSKTKNPTNVNIILNMSVFFTFLFTMIVLKIDTFHVGYYSLGLIFIVMGLFLIQLSYN